MFTYLLSIHPQYRHTFMRKIIYYRYPMSTFQPQYRHTFMMKIKYYRYPMPTFQKQYRHTFMMKIKYYRYPVSTFQPHPKSVASSVMEMEKVKGFTQMLHCRTCFFLSKLLSRVNVMLSKSNVFVFFIISLLPDTDNCCYQMFANANNIISL